MKEKNKSRENEEINCGDGTSEGSESLRGGFSFSTDSHSGAEDRSHEEGAGDKWTEGTLGGSLDDIPECSMVEEDCSPSKSSSPSSLTHSKASLIQMYKLFGGSVRSSELRSFVERYSNQILGVVKDSKDSSSILQCQPLSCPTCFGVWLEPVTIPCGHSYCRKCLLKFVPGDTCKKCNYEMTRPDIHQTKIDVLMVALIEKLWPKSRKTSLLRDEGTRLFENGNLDDSLWKYSQAIRLSPDDHMSWANRSHVQLVLGRAEAALEDANQAITLCPMWPKGYFRKASALITSEKYDEAFINLTLCMFIIKSNQWTDVGALRPVQNELSRVLHKIFLQYSGGVCPGIFNVRRHSIDHLLFSPYPIPKSKSHRDRMLALSGELSETDASYSSGDEVDSPLGKQRDRLNSSTLCKSCPYLPSTRSSYCASSAFDISCHQFVTRTQQLFQDTSKALSNLRENLGQLKSEESLFRNIQPSVTLDNLECSLCYRLFHEPVVTPCGHTYCRTCLERSLDHSSDCPLCKTSLFDTLARRQFHVTDFVDKVVAHYLPTERSDRLTQHAEEIAEAATPDRSNDIEIPIFVCTMAFPGVACPLHIFEPRYRLMIRRAMESGSRKFGMCCYLQDAEGNYANFGTLLEVTSVQYFPDGRSVIDTVGVRRFKVLKKSMKDGYNTASIEYIVDGPVHPELKQRLEETHRNVYSAAVSWLDSINQVLKQRITTHFGNIPVPEENWMEIGDGPSWIWWLLAILPLDSKAQLAILSMDSLQKRFDSILKVLNFVKSSSV